MRGCGSFSNEVPDNEVPDNEVPDNEVAEVAEVADAISMLIAGVIKMVSNELSDGSEHGVKSLVLDSLVAASNESFFVISMWTGVEQAEFSGVHALSSDSDIIIHNNIIIFMSLLRIY
jgi:hypothetical protein